VLPASSLPARNGLAGGGLVGSISRGCWYVLSACLCLPQLREGSEQRSGDFGITHLEGVAALNIQRIVYRVSAIRFRMGCHHFTPLRSPSPHNAASHPPTCGPHCALKMTSSQSSHATLQQLQVIFEQLCSVACWMFWHSRPCWEELVGWERIFEVLSQCGRRSEVAKRPRVVVKTWNGTHTHCGQQPRTRTERKTLHHPHYTFTSMRTYMCRQTTLRPMHPFHTHKHRQADEAA
jgi:hypothetical protein